MHASLKVCDDVVADGVRQLTRRQQEMHTDAALAHQIRHQVCVFRRHGGGGNARRILRVTSLPRMRKTVFRAADRAYERGDGPQARGCAWALAAILYGLGVSVNAEALSGHLLIETDVEEHDLARHLRA